MRGKTAKLLRKMCKEHEQYDALKASWPKVRQEDRNKIIQIILHNIYNNEGK